MTIKTAAMSGYFLAVSWMFLAPSARADDPPPDKSEFSVFDPTPDADLRSFGTDRPPKANGPYTVDAGHIQYETDIAVYADSKTNGVSTSAWTLVDPTLKLGLTNTVDLEVQVTPYERLHTSSASGSASVSGAGDIYAKVKFNLKGDDAGDFAVALMPYVKIPTASAGLGNGSVEGGFVVPLGFNAPHGFVVVVMPQFDYLKNTIGSGYSGAADFLVNVSHALNKKWTVYTELFTTQYFERHTEAVYTVDTALTYLIRPNLQLDFGANESLNAVSPQNQIYVGISQRF